MAKDPPVPDELLNSLVRLSLRLVTEAHEMDERVQKLMAERSLSRFHKPGPAPQPMRPLRPGIPRPPASRDY